MSRLKPSLHRASVWILSGIAAIVPFCLGGVPDWTVWTAAIPIGLLTTFELYRDSRRLSIWLAVPLAACAYYGFQVIPMPVAFIEYLSPHAATLYREIGVSIGTISLNRYETVLSIGLQSIFVCSLFLGTRISGRQVRKVLTVLAISIALMSVTGWLHLMLGWTSIFNFYQPADLPNPRGFYTAFVNANSAASFLCLGVAINLGLTFEQAKANRARLTMFGAYVCASGVILTQSKGGLIALLCICLVWVYCLFLNPRNYRIRERLPYRLTLLWFLVQPPLSAWFLMFLPQVDNAEEWSAALGRKLQVWQATNYLQDYWFAGSGRGTFEVVYPIYQAESIQGTVTHAENIVFQLLGETGLFVGLLVMVWALMLPSAYAAGSDQFSTHQMVPLGCGHGHRAAADGGLWLGKCWTHRPIRHLPRSFAQISRQGAQAQGAPSRSGTVPTLPAPRVLGSADQSCVQ